MGAAVYKVNFLGQDVKYNLDESLVGGRELIFLSENFQRIILSLLLLMLSIEELNQWNMDLLLLEIRHIQRMSFLLQLMLNIMNGKWLYFCVKKIGVLLPYIGAKYSDVCVSSKVQAGGIVYHMNITRSDKVLGMILGCSLFEGGNFIVDGETRFGDEIAITLRAGYSF
ncbi:MAG: hypothetical protein KAI72_07235 [Candidatus Pacebacteria bacterium]|nr:hypothetical protein [Candidatus Paceibacterota bacterium]